MLAWLGGLHIWAGIDITSTSYSLPIPIALSFPSFLRQSCRWWKLSITVVHAMGSRVGLR